ncbi:MAG: hypothetical protein ACREN2_12220 [Candidatus Dormibacteria bacterium]
MKHVLAKVAAASGLAAVAATPFTLSAFAGTSPVPGVPVPSVSSLTSQVNTALAQVEQALGLHPVVVSSPAAAPVADPSGQAPAGSATANAVSIPLLDTCVSCTNADAGSNSADGNATALRLLGHDVEAGHMSGNNSGAGALIALPVNPLLNLAVADWMAAANAGSAASTASARSALVDLGVGNQILTLSVLEAGSNASWTGNSSQGNGYTNGVHLNLGNGALVVILLHSDSDSNSGSHAYVASINGTSILSNTQIGQPITITIPGVITITLLQTSANGGLTVGSVATASNLLNMPGTQAGLFTTSGSGTHGGSGQSNTGSGVQAASTGSELGVPETGVGIGILGFVLATAGAAAAVASRLRRQATVS